MALESKNEYLLGTPGSSMTLLNPFAGGTNYCAKLQTFAPKM